MITDLTERDLNAGFNLVYAVCLCRALGYPLKDLEDELKDKSIEPELLEVIKRQNNENIEMLRAILLRTYIDFTESGFSESEAATVLIRCMRNRKRNIELV